MSLKKQLTLFRPAILLLLGVQLMSCSWLKSPQESALTQVANYPFFELMAVPESLQNRVWLDKFTISFNGVAHEVAPQNMLLQSELRENTINIAAMSFTGIPLAQASWDETTQKLVSYNAVDRNFNPQQVIHDLQCVNWPLALIKNSLFAGFSVDEEIIDDVKIRRFYFKQKLIVKITNQANKISFDQIEQGYQISVLRLEDNLLNSASSNEFK